jgi:hypothetical protein
MSRSPTKPRRKAAQANPASSQLSILDACRDRGIFGAWFKDVTTWAAWFSFMAAMFAIPLTAEQLEVFRQCTGRTAPNPAGYLEATLICGRRAGKSLILALIAAYLAMFRDWSPYLVGGERATIIIVAGDKKQGRAIFRYLKGMLSIPLFAGMIERETAEALDLSNGVTIEILAANFRTLRSYTCVAALCDEEAFWPTDEGLLNPDIEIIGALKPTMATVPGALLLKASSPYARKGDLYEDFKRHYGQDDSPVLVWRASTRTMNPTVPESFIAAAFERDPAWAAAEYNAEFRSDISGFLTADLVEAAVDSGVAVRPPNALFKGSYVAFADPSGGARDSYTCAVAHQDGEQAVLDCLLEIKPPFNPQAATERIVATLKQYGISTVQGDRYAAEWVTSAFKANGVTYRNSERDRSTIYADVLPLFTSGRARLLDNRRMVGQLCALERKTSSMGKDRIDHGPSGHDDLCNAAAGALVNAIRAKKPTTYHAPFVDSGANYFAAFDGGARIPSGAFDLGGSYARPGGEVNPINEERRKRT